MAYRVKYLGPGEYWVFGHRFASGQERIVESEAEAAYLRRLGSERQPLFRVEELSADAELPSSAQTAQPAEVAVTIAGGPMTTADLAGGVATGARRRRGR